MGSTSFLGFSCPNLLLVFLNYLLFFSGLYTAALWKIGENGTVGSSTVFQTVRYMVSELMVYLMVRLPTPRFFKWHLVTVSPTLR